MAKVYHKNPKTVEAIIDELVDRNLYRPAISAVSDSRCALVDVLTGYRMAHVVSARGRVIRAIGAAEVTMSDSLIAKILRIDRTTVRAALSERECDDVAEGTKNEGTGPEAA